MVKIGQEQTQRRVSRQEKHQQKTSGLSRDRHKITDQELKDQLKITVQDSKDQPVITVQENSESMNQEDLSSGNMPTSHCIDGCAVMDKLGMIVKALWKLIQVLVLLKDLTYVFFISAGVN